MLSIAKSIREEKPSVKIILGGPEVSFNATEILSENAFVDYVISGQGEKAFAKLLVSVSKGEEPSLNEVSFRTEEGINEGSYQIFEGDLSPYTEATSLAWVPRRFPKGDLKALWSPPQRRNYCQTIIDLCDCR